MNVEKINYYLNELCVTLLYLAKSTSLVYLLGSINISLLHLNKITFCLFQYIKARPSARGPSEFKGN